MCGILGLIRRDAALEEPTLPLVMATRRVRHRGPDDEGYLLWNPDELTRVYAGDETSPQTRDTKRLVLLPSRTRWRVGLGHRRLSIVDLSPGGHQPMLHHETGLAIVLNGEIYNHVELRADLERMGHRFASRSDTEVLLAAWAEWGPGCLDRLNGMFAFLLLDPRNGGTLHAVRDRFGVKPLYWAVVGGFIALASEIKQIRTLPGYKFAPDETGVRRYLVDARLDASSDTMHDGVHQLRGGERVAIDLRSRDAPVKVTRWYRFAPATTTRNLRDAAARVRELLTDSIALRLRADVPVGSCLSGGLDSSAIVCLAHRQLAAYDADAGQVTVTARHSDAAFDEWQYAEGVIRATHAKSVGVWPKSAELVSDLDELLWHMDEPFGSTSMYSQWCVFQAAADAGLKVMLDGQGSDEQLAGYGGNDTALYTGMLRRGRMLRLAGEINAYRRRQGTLPIAQLILAMRNVMPAVDTLLPARVRITRSMPTWLRAVAPNGHDDTPPIDLRDSLRRQTFDTSLPVLLRYEDRNSMAWSIESRVPFLDYRLVEFLAGLPDEMKLHRGVTKVVLRRAVADVLPPTVRDRRDKMGFVTPERTWLSEIPREWTREQLRVAIDCSPNVLHADAALKEVEDILAGRAPFSFLPWRFICLGRWLRNNSEGDDRSGDVSSDNASRQRTVQSAPV
ncbi:MAG TPA: asparagine synthase (glutamine-hydrolyzing) [Gemmatimonadaceae bacterium]|nr:asparagine synthase (glutamine-hydrolyzing) [Gemmatimonadaceae bacterium]